MKGQFDSYVLKDVLTGFPETTREEDEKRLRLVYSRAKRRGGKRKFGKKHITKLPTIEGQIYRLEMASQLSGKAEIFGGNVPNSRVA